MKHRSGEAGSTGRICFALAASAFLGWGALGGCSLLFDIGELPGIPVDADADAIVDANPDAISIAEISSPALEEGVGDGDSRPGLLVVVGADLEQKAQVEITHENDARESVPVAGLTLGEVAVSADHKLLAVPVSIAASAALAGNVDVPLRVRLTKPNHLGEAITFDATWNLKGRFELDKTGLILAEGVSKPHIYSKVEVTGNLTVQGDQVLVMRSNSTFRIAGTFDLSASGKSPGVAGGAAGGEPAKVGGGPAGGSGGVGTVGGDGGGAGYASPGKGGASASPTAGDPQISSFLANRSSGGGGGGVLSLLGGAGGGGGGAIELSARGELTVGDISSNGGAGASLLNGSGGGGSGGTIVLRSGTKVTSGVLAALGGRGGATNNANSGSEGRIRVDAAEVAGTARTPVVRGAMFDPATPLIVREKKLPLRLFSIPGTRFQLHAFDARGGSVGNGPLLADFQASSELILEVPLTPGYNRLCTVPFDSSTAHSESTNCLEVAFIAK